MLISYVLETQCGPQPATMQRAAELGATVTPMTRGSCMQSIKRRGAMARAVSAPVGLCAGAMTPGARAAATEPASSEAVAGDAATMHGDPSWSDLAHTAASAGLFLERVEACAACWRT